MILLKTLEIAHGPRGVFIHVIGNIIRNRDGTFERSEILVKKYRELLVRAKKIGKKFCVSGILLRLGENVEWWSRTLGVNERAHMLCEISGRERRVAIA